MIRPILIPALLLGGCASAPKAPDWVDGAAETYPKTEFLLGRGSGATVAVAQERARADLAKSVTVAVSASGRDTQRAVTGSVASMPAGATYESSHEQQIETRSDAVLRGMRIAELWRDPETSTQHALAVLPRLQTAQALRREMAQLDEGIERQLAAAQGAADPLAKLRPAEQAVVLGESRAALDHLLRVVDSTGAGMPPAQGLARLRADRDALVGRVRIAVPAGAGEDGSLSALVAAKVAEAGFEVVSGSVTDAYQLSPSLDVQDLGRQDGWYWLRASLRVVMADTGGQARGSHTWTFKASAADEGAARQRLYKEMERVLGAEMRAVVVGFAS